jgi:hypothetical protein
MVILSAAIASKVGELEKRMERGPAPKLPGAVGKCRSGAVVLWDFEAEAGD